MTKQTVQVAGLRDSEPSGYAQCVVANDLIFVAGQLGTDSQSTLVSLEFEGQATQALRNVEAALAAAGASLSDIVTMTVFLADSRHGKPFNELRKTFLGGAIAASTTIGGATFAQPGALIEIQAIAAR